MTARRRRPTLNLTLLLLSLFYAFFASTSPALAVDVNVTWTNLVSATASSNTLTSTAVGGHAESTQSIASGNGSAKATVKLNTQSSYLSFGLNNGTFTGDYTQIDYAWLYYQDGAWASVRINGTIQVYTTVSTNDVLEVRLNGTTIEWYKNNSLVHSVPSQTFSYPYRMAATFNDSTGQIASATMSGVSGGSIPTSAPSGLAVTNGTGTDLNLSWTYTGTGQDGFRIERRLGAGDNFAELITVGSAARSYTDTGAKSNNRPYIYQVRAYNATGNTAYSNQAQATTPYTGSGTIKTDRAVYAEPSFPASQLPLAGGKFYDEVFGTQIMRVTDASDGASPGLSTFHSHWPVFNVDNTRLLIRKGQNGEAIVKNFIPATFTLGSTITLPTTRPGTNYTVNWESSYWHPTDPNILYTFPADNTGGLKLISYNVVTNVWQTLKDFSGLSGVIVGEDFLSQMYMSADGDIFSWSHFRIIGNTRKIVYYLVYKKSTDTVLAHNPNNYDPNISINEVHIDRSGKWLHIPVDDTLPDNSRTRYLNVETGALSVLINDGYDRPTGHGDLGFGNIIGSDPNFSGLHLRYMNDLHNPLVMTSFHVNGTRDWTEDFHGTMLADDQTWITIGTYDDKDVTGVNAGESGVFEDEIIQIPLDGSNRVRRIAHTRTFAEADADANVQIGKQAWNDIWAMPHPSISKDGKFIAYTSNWENSGRYDMFIAKITPPAPATIPTPVTWTSIVNAESKGGFLQTTTSNGRAESTQSIASGNGSTQGFITFHTGTIFFGLTNNSFTGNNSELDYSWHVAANATTATYRINGVSQGSTPFTDGTALSIKINGTSVEWYKNGELVYTATNQTLSYPYRTAAFVTNQEEKVTAAQMTGVSSQTSGNVTWTNLVNATASGNTLTSTAVGGHAESTQSITSGNGSAKATVKLNTQSSYLSFGLVNGTFTGDYTQIDYAWLYYQDGVTASVRINGTIQTYTSVSTNDVLEVRLNGTTVEWYKNNALVHSVPSQTFTYPYRMAATFNDATGQIANAMITGGGSPPPSTDVNWINKVNATASGNTLTSTAVGGHAESEQTIISGNGSAKATVNLTSQSSYLSFGLMNGTFTGDYNQIDYAWLYYQDGVTASVRINGTIQTYTSVSQNDVLEVRLNGTTVEWYKNNSLVHSVPSQTFSYPYRMAATFNDATGQIGNAIIID